MSAPPELEASPSPLHDGDYSSIKINVAAAEAALQAVESCKARLVDLTDRACASFSAVIAKLLSSFSTTVSSARTTARRVCQRRAEWLGKHVEELDAVQEALLAAARLCGYHLTNTHLSGDASTLLLDLEPVMGLLRSGDALVRQSCALYAPDPVHFTDVIEVLLKMSRVQSGELSASSSTLTGPAIDFLTPGGPCDQNTLSITCLDDEGDPIRGLDASDVQLTLESATTGDGSSIGSVVSVSIDAEVGVVTIAFVVQDSTETDVRICVRVGSLTFPEAVSRIGRTITGVYEGIIKLHTRVNNYGFALSMREDAVIVSNWSSCNLTAYDVNTSEVLWTVGSNGTGELQFRSPMKLCCAPDNGNILVAEDTNNRVQELTPDGGFVRFLGVGVITTASYGISASADLIAIGAWSSSADEQITILDRSTGALVRRFANGGSFPGQLLNVYGLRFSRDGRQLYCVEIVSHRVSVFTTDGEFLRIITDESLGQVGDVDFARNGDIIITNRSRNQIAVFSPAGVLLRSFGSDSMFAQPTALAVSRSGSLYVLDLNAARVQVFT